MSLFDLKGRVALVTGGNGGIGLGMARGLAQAGAAIAVAGRNQAKSEAAAAELGKLGVATAVIAVDVTDEAQCRKMVDDTVTRLGRLDILVNNAGINIRKQPQDYTVGEWKEVIDTNLTSAFSCCQAVYPTMKAAGGGKIINIGSMLSIFGAPFAAAYGASKGGIVQLTKALATSWARDNIQVNAVLPGWIDTELTRQGRNDVPGLDERVIARTPAGRWGLPEDLAGIAVFLASRGSDFITGAEIHARAYCFHDTPELRRRADDLLRGCAESVDRLRGQNERSRQTVEVIALRLILQRRKRYIDHVDIDVRRVHELRERRVLSANAVDSRMRRMACHRASMSFNSSTASRE
jgi:2-deoxy-D-gluconate 3-dehydrogenase